MAAGKYEGCRDNKFRNRESVVDASRRRDFNYSKEEYDRHRNTSDRERGRGRGRDDRDRTRVRQKDIKEREMIICGYHSSSSASNSGSGGSGPRQDGVSVRTADREPGELSSGSGSDGAIDYGAIGNDVSKLENGAWSPLGQKRKFSPIVWDRLEKEVSNSPKNKTVPTSTSLPIHPSLLSKSFNQSPNIVADEGVKISLIKPNQFQTSKSSPVKLPVAPGSVGSVESESLVNLTSSLPLEQHCSNDQEPGQLEEEESVPARNISSSRWANERNSPGDEGEVSDDEDTPKRRKMIHPSKSWETRFNTNLLSLELGEFKGDGSEGARAKSSGSDEGGCCDGHVSGEECPENEGDKKNSMDGDENNHVSVDQPDTESEDENDSPKTSEPVCLPQRSINTMQGCRSVFEFESLNRIDEGTYGVVFRAKDNKTGEIVALKKVKMEKEREGFPLTSLREINILLSFHHPSIVDVKEVVMGENLDNIFMVMEYMEHDLKGLMESKKQAFSQSEVKCLMLQLLEGVKYLHDNWVLHRDLKTSNILLNNRGELKICDFGLSRQYGSPLKTYTHLVVTLWYRAPELLLGAKKYSTAIDMWSLGCIMAELLANEPLFTGKTEVDQLDKIFRTLGTPSELIWPGFSKLPRVKVNFVKHQYNLRKKFPSTSFTGSPVLSDSGFDLLNKLLTYDPEKRITAEAALNHDWFREVPLPKSKDFMPTFPAQHAQDRRLRRIMKSPDPLEEQRIKELRQRELGTVGLFGLEK
ncbi:hypothetical protein HHK36_029467 [Tetracentron sinense]|uniref:cyclin-dependent kinase n=1 Tax=Tetracentron sinense TaxID=13715 RepID=A0A835CZR9_TETSI|nr:hypothetical protein HHK36_029467 [Tetracentron sinense]